MPRSRRRSSSKPRGTPIAEIRRIRAEEWELWRDLRLRSLAESPLSFGTTHAEAAARTDDEWREQARELAETVDHAVFVAGHDGVVRVSRVPEQPDLFGIYSFWVAPEARGRRLAARLLEAAEAWARSRGGTRAELSVREAAHVARHVYERAGYTYDGRAQTSLHGVVELGMTKEL